MLTPVVFTPVQQLRGPERVERREARAKDAPAGADGAGRSAAPLDAPRSAADRETLMLSSGAEGDPSLTEGAAASETGEALAARAEERAALARAALAVEAEAGFDAARAAQADPDAAGAVDRKIG